MASQKPLMEVLKDLDTQHGQEIPNIMPATFKALIPRLLGQKDKVFSTKRETLSYGPHPRQELDWYTSPSLPLDAPFMIFLHGGGLSRGSKQEDVPMGIVFSNLGHYFVEQGFETLIPNYRRVNLCNPQTGEKESGEDATFPSGGEDVATVLDWLDSKVPSTGKQRQVHIIGCSAGGIHLGTYLFHVPFFPDKIHGGGYKGLIVSSGFFLSAPFSFGAAPPVRKAILEQYWQPGKFPMKKFSPYGLLESFNIPDPENAHKGPTVTIITAEFDPPEILQPAKEFTELIKGKAGFKYEELFLKGHNHISPPMTLATGEKDAESWAQEVIKLARSRQ